MRYYVNVAVDFDFFFVKFHVLTIRLYGFFCISGNLYFDVYV